MNRTVAIKSLFIFIMLPKIILKQIYTNHTKVNRQILISILQNIENAKRVHRSEAALKVINSPDLISYLVIETFYVSDILSVRAAWVLEWICSHHGVHYLLPHLQVFVDNLHKVKFDGSIRSCAKICEQISTIYNSEISHPIHTTITNQQVNTIIETCFDWLITPQKVAVKAYSMTTLYYFGLQTDWVHTALTDIIKKDIPHQSKAYAARGKKLLDLMNNKNTSFTN